MSSVVRLMRTGPRKLPARRRNLPVHPCRRGRSSPCAQTGIFAQKSLAHDLFIIPQNTCFFKHKFSSNCEKCGKSRLFIKHLTKNEPLKRPFLLAKRPGACSSVILENARQRVYLRYLYTIASGPRRFAIAKKSYPSSTQYSLSRRTTLRSPSGEYSASTTGMRPGVSARIASMASC